MLFSCVHFLISARNGEWPGSSLFCFNFSTHWTEGRVEYKAGVNVLAEKGTSTSIGKRISFIWFLDGGFTAFPGGATCWFLWSNNSSSNILTPAGRFMVQALSSLPLTAYTWFRYLAGLRGIFFGQSGTVTCILLRSIYFWLHPVRIIQQAFHSRVSSPTIDTTSALSLHLILSLKLFLS